MAMTVMTGAAENGVVVQFMQNLIHTDSLKQIDEQLQETFTQMELSACVLADINCRKQYLELGRAIKPIEKDVLIQVEINQQEKIKTFSNKCTLKNPHCVLLIRAMPDDEEKAGRYKDHLAVLIDALESKLVQIEEYQNRLQHYAELTTVTEKTFGQLQAVRTNYQQQRAENVRILTELTDNIENLYMHLGLDENQEKNITGLINDAESRSNQIYEDGEIAMNVFDEILQNLKNLHDI